MHVVWQIFQSVQGPYDSEYSHSSVLVTWVRIKSCQPDLRFFRANRCCGWNHHPSAGYWCCRPWLRWFPGCDVIRCWRWLKFVRKSSDRPVPGDKTDLEEVKIIDRETRWFERGVKEAIWVRAENPSLNRSGGVRIKLSHTWDRTIRTLPHKLMSSSTSDDVTFGKSPESRSTTSVPSWRVVICVGLLRKNISLVDKIEF